MLSISGTFRDSMCKEAGEFIYVMAYMYIAFLFVLVSIKLAKSYMYL